MKFLSLLVLAFSLFAKDEFFFEKPYLQLGDRPTMAAKGALDLMWLGHDKDTAYTVEYKTSDKWIVATPQMLRRVDFLGTAPHRVYSAALTKLKPGANFTYRISVAGKPVFESSAIARKSSKQDSHFVVFGDCAANTAGQRQIAFHAAQQKPDYVFITGDIVYSRGRVSEYQTNFWPVYNNEKADPTQGAPILRNTLFAAAVGNHDSQPEIDAAKNPDPLAYYYYWNQPTNGPGLKVDGKHVPHFIGDPAVKKNFLDTAKGAYPAMANFTFDYANVHWTVIDSNGYVDWTDAELRDWVEKDLKAASKAKWRLVAFHHPPFNSSKVAHFKEQRLRVISDILEKYKVDLVLSGHVHDYQRTFPLTFETQPGFVLGKNQEVPGKWTLDKAYDSTANTKPKGVIYITTGAGGAGQYPKEYNVGPEYLQEFTTKFVPFPHSFSVIDTTSKQLTFRQINAEGKEVDRFVIKR
jgi:Icc-related predicted phosphoesterase